MTLRLSNSLHPHRAALGVRWLVLVVIMFGTIISSVGGMHSHGRAAITAVFHAAPTSPDTSHELVQEHAREHAHDNEDSGLAMVNPGSAADHPPHGADHSHDKAHALPSALRSAPPQLPGWAGLVQPWILMVQASRLERPPMG